MIDFSRFGSVRSEVQILSPRLFISHAEFGTSDYLPSLAVRLKGTSLNGHMSVWTAFRRCRSCQSSQKVFPAFAETKDRDKASFASTVGSFTMLFVTTFWTFLREFSSDFPIRHCDLKCEPWP